MSIYQFSSQGSENLLKKPNRALTLIWHYNKLHSFFIYTGSRYIRDRCPGLPYEQDTQLLDNYLLKAAHQIVDSTSLFPGSDLSKKRGNNAKPRKDNALFRTGDTPQLLEHCIPEEAAGPGRV